MVYSDRDKRRRFLRRKPSDGFRKMKFRYWKLNEDSEYEGPSRLPTHKRRLCGWKSKSSGWYSFPYDDYFKSKIGQNWDDVYSEISRIVDHRGRSASKFFEHCVNSQVERYYSDLYVAEDRTIQKLEEERYSNWYDLKSDEKDPNFILIDDVREYQKINGNWFYVERHPEIELFWMNWKMERERKPKRFYHRIIIKRQLGKKILKEFRKNELPKATNLKYYERTGRTTPVLSD